MKAAERPRASATRLQPVRRWRAWLLVGIGLAASAEGGRRLWEQRAERAAMMREAAGQRAELAQWVARRDALRQELTAARQQHAELQSLGRADPAETTAAPDEVGAWLWREKQLRDLMRTQPMQRIPELQLLSDDDWLRAARDARLDTEDGRRRALAKLRDSAKRVFTQRLSTAVASYSRRSGSDGSLPVSLLTLAPYFEAPIDPAILARYHMVQGADPSNPWNAAIEEIAAIDADFDTRYAVSRNGAARMSPAPEAWIPGFQERRRLAWRAYQAAHGGVPPERTSEMLPFFDPPLAPETEEKIIQAERERPAW